MPDTLPATEFMPLVVARKAEIANDIFGFELEAAGDAVLPGYGPGAHITVETPSGARRCYSLCGTGTDLTRYELGIKAERPGRGASLSMIETLNEGDIVPVLPPENSFELVDADQYLFIAGGIGITPIMSMLRHLRETGHRRFRLIYCARDELSTAFLDELRDGFYADKVTIHHDDGDPDRIFDLWPLFETPGPAHVYCCGPRPMMDEVRDMTGHWKPGSIHFEDFAADVEAVRENDQPFTVRHADSGESFQVPADATILETLRRGGCTLRSSCESGTCGTCRVELVAGIADHRDMVLEERERNSHIMICVSRARSGELVLRW